MAYQPRAYITAMPKAGLHMLEQMVAVLLSKSDVGGRGTQWLGTYTRNSWTMHWRDIRNYLWRMSCLERGHYLMGHAGYHEDTANMLRYGNIGHIFLHRDFRDIAVSQAHHIWDEGHPELEHQHKDVYRMLGSFDAVLLAVIEGLGPYPGVMERWAEYAPWLEDEETLVLEYGKMLANPKRAAAGIVVYLLKKATEFLDNNDFGVDISAENLVKVSEQMTEATKEKSTTFRKGVAGGWRDEFKPEHVEAFKATDVDGWLVKLGYEEGQEWDHDGTGQGPGEPDPVRNGGQ